MEVGSQENVNTSMAKTSKMRDLSQTLPQ